MKARVIRYRDPQTGPAESGGARAFLMQSGALRDSEYVRLIGRDRLRPRRIRRTRRQREAVLRQVLSSYHQGKRRRKSPLLRALQELSSRVAVSPEDPHHGWLQLDPTMGGPVIYDYRIEPVREPKVKLTRCTKSLKPIVQAIRRGFTNESQELRWSFRWFFAIRTMIVVWFETLDGWVRLVLTPKPSLA